MLKSTVFLSVILLYIFNVSTFLLWYYNGEKNKSKISKLLNIYFVFSIGGLPTSMLFFFKIKIYTTILKQTGLYFYIIFFIILLISLYIVFNMNFYFESHTFARSNQIIKKNLTEIVFLNFLFNFFFTIVLISSFI